MTTIRIEERANPAAVGWRWMSESGRLWEVVWSRSADSQWLLGIQGEDGRWQNTVAPGIPRAATLKEARAIAHAFVNGDD